MTGEDQGGDWAVQRCVNLPMATSAVTINYGITHRGAGAAGVDCGLEVFESTSTDCGLPVLVESSALINPGASWTEYDDSFMLGDNIESLRVDLFCTVPGRVPEGPSYQVLVDDSYVGQNLMPVELQSFSID